MELHEKLQALRRARGLTQEEVAQELGVSHTDVSEWESGRSAPERDPLKALAAFYGVSPDELLSDTALPTGGRWRGTVFALLDLGAAAMLVLPLFGERSGADAAAVSLLAFTGGAAYVRALGVAVVAVLMSVGIALLAVQRGGVNARVWRLRRASLYLGVGAAMLFAAARQPCAAVFALVLLAAKVALLAKRR